MTATPVLGGIVVCRPAPFSVRSGDAVGLRLMSDLHIGASHVDYKLIEKELEEAGKNKDRILLNGDVLDMILAGDKKRFSPDVLHPRLQGRRDIVNAAIDWAVEILKPYAHLIDMVGVGNHETAVEHHHSKDVTRDIVRELSRAAAAKDKKHVVHYGGYTGFVDYRFRSVRQGDGRPLGRGKGLSNSARWVLYYHHGSGGAAPVTKGMVDFNRKDVFIHADALWMGHKHQRWAGGGERYSCPMQGDRVRVSEVRHVMTGAYFKTYVAQSQESLREHGRRTNYAADAGMAPALKGGARVLLTFHHRQNTTSCKATVTQ